MRSPACNSQPSRAPSPARRRIVRLLAASALALAGCQSADIRDEEPVAGQEVPEIYGVVTVEGRGVPFGSSDGAGPYFLLEHSSVDPRYGRSAEQPIAVGGVRDGPRRVVLFLDALRSPDGRPIEYERLGSCCALARAGQAVGLLDVFAVTGPGLEGRVLLYFDAYREGELAVPTGFVARPRSTASFAPAEVTPGNHCVWPEYVVYPGDTRRGTGWRRTDLRGRTEWTSNADASKELAVRAGPGTGVLVLNHRSHDGPGVHAERIELEGTSVSGALARARGWLFYRRLDASCSREPSEVDEPLLWRLLITGHYGTPGARLCAPGPTCADQIRVRSRASRFGRVLLVRRAFSESTCDYALVLFSEGPDRLDEYDRVLAGKVCASGDARAHMPDIVDVIEGLGISNWGSAV